MKSVRLICFSYGFGDLKVHNVQQPDSDVNLNLNSTSKFKFKFQEPL